MAKVTEVPDIELFEISEEGQVPLQEAPKAGRVAGAPTPSWRGGDRPIVSDRPVARGEVDENGHRIVLIDGELFTVVEGDLVLDIDQKDLWQEAHDFRQMELQTRLRLQQAGLGAAAINQFGIDTGTSALIGIVQGGKLVRWSPGTVLSYCVLANTFPRQEWYDEVVTNMQRATAAWEEACGVQFEYVADLDSSTSVRPSGVLFPVRHINAGGAFIAAAFFPNDLPSRRRLLIDPSYFSTTFDHAGVLRHELGHVIGCRHEHIRSGAPSICPDEDTTGTIDLTNYDPQSVMHYFCGGVGSKRLEISQLDRIGAQQLYGPPLSAFEFHDA